MTILNCDQIKSRILEENMIQDYRNLDVQIQPNGFDMSVGQVYKFIDRGEIDFNNTKRLLPDLELRLPYVGKQARGSYYNLSQGCYLIEYHETVNMPKDLMGISVHRSSMLRCGVSVETGIWDAGYIGKGKTLIVIQNPYGLFLDIDARISQMLFFELDKEPSKLYEGVYKQEGIK